MNLPFIIASHSKITNLFAGIHQLEIIVQGLGLILIRIESELFNITFIS